MASPITVFQGSTGLNTKVDPTRVRFDRDAGLSDLAVAYNVDHDASGRVSRRKGYGPTGVTSASHSLWSAGDAGPCFFVSGNSLHQLHTDFSSTSIAAVTAGAKVRYALLANQVCWLNGVEKGLISDGVNQDWLASTYVGPDTHRSFINPPIGHLIAVYRGRIWIGQGAVAWYSEPFSTGLFDPARNYVSLATRLRMLAPADRALFISDQTTTYALVGDVPDTMQLSPVANYPAIEGTETPVDLHRIGSGELYGTGVMWASARGICIGTPEGRMFNLTERKFDLPTVAAGAGAVVGDRYVATLQP